MSLSEKAKRRFEVSMARKEEAIEILSAIESMTSSSVISVAGKTGAVILNKSDVGLSNVDNTSDTNKPVSSATQTSLDTKLTKGSKTILCIDNGDYVDGQAAIDAASTGDTIVFGAKDGGWGNINIPAGKRLSLIGLSGAHGLNVVVGSITFSPSSGVITSNEIYIENLFIVSNSASITFSGSAPARLRVYGCYINTTGSGRAIVADNSGASSHIYINNCLINQVGSTSPVIELSNVYSRIYYTAVDSPALLLKVNSGFVECADSNFNGTRSAEIINVIGGTLLAGRCGFNNSIANGSGIAMATPAVLSQAFNSFAVAAGTGYCISGTGTHFYGPMVNADSIALSYNVKIQNTITSIPYTTSLTPSP